MFRHLLLPDHPRVLLVVGGVAARTEVILVALDQVTVVQSPLLEATGQKIDVREVFFSNELGVHGALALILPVHDDDFAGNIPESHQRSQVVLAVDPAVRKVHSAGDVVLVELLGGVDALTTAVEQNYVLLRDI